MTNMYSSTVREHWQTYRPQEWAAMADPETFVTEKAREIETRILVAEEALEKAVPEPTEYEAAVGRIRQIRADATAMVLADLLPEPEPRAEKAPEQTPMERHLQEIRDLMYDA
ncbi:hypothetical protein [Streptomyces atroolivaceus]|uniref:hypothetical protein n=1 Tax=Streptomyces atroolivaceus TaxID=66869 RepID=UPI002024A36D|nr:hypothetical protein [Streptomyces atroolivaceus]